MAIFPYGYMDDRILPFDALRLEYEKNLMPERLQFEVGRLVRPGAELGLAGSPT